MSTQSVYVDKHVDVDALTFGFHIITSSPSILNKVKWYIQQFEIQKQ